MPQEFISDALCRMGSDLSRVLCAGWDRYWSARVRSPITGVGVMGDEVSFVVSAHDGGTLDGQKCSVGVFSVLVW